MSKCINCGKELKEGMNFCPSCGTKQSPQSVFESTESIDSASSEMSTVVSSQEEPSQQQIQEAQSEMASTTAPIQENASSVQYDQSIRQEPESQPVWQEGSSPQPSAENAPATKAKKKINAGMIILVAACLFALLFGGVSISNARRTIDLNKFTTVSFEGFDGYGSADVTIDWDAIEEQYGERISLNKKAKDYLGGWAEFYEPVEALQLFVDYSLDKRRDLSNGDTVALTYEIDEDYSKVLNCKLKFKDSSVEVDSLETVASVDPFDKLTVSFRGVDGSGEMSVEYDGQVFSTNDFSVSGAHNLSNGDEIKVTFSADKEKYARSEGVIPSVMEKTYIVEGLGHYMMSLSELPKKDVDALTENSRTVIDTYIGEFDPAVTADSVECVGSYFRVKTNASILDAANYYGVVYKITGHIQPEEDVSAEEFTDYIFVEYPNILIQADGTASYSFDYSSLPVATYFTKIINWGDSVFDFTTYYFNGFKSIEELKHHHSWRYSGEYDYEWHLEE